MQEDIDLYIEAAQESMDEAISRLQRELSKVRTGKASPSVFDNLMVSYYGSPTPLKQVANVSVPDARTILVKPWEKSVVPAIEKAIFSANMGFTPQNDGETIRLNVPPLTEERRVDLVKQCKTYLEDAKISIRNARRESISGIKDAVKDGYPEDAGKKAEDTVDNLSKKFYTKGEAAFKQKDADIMTV